MLEAINMRIEMKKRSPFLVFLFPFITLGIYSLYWLVVTKGEMNAKGEKIPTAWLLLASIIPVLGWFVALFWLYKYSEGVDHVTGGGTSAILAFLLLWFLGPIGMAVVQAGFNKVGGDAKPAEEKPAQEAPAAPAA